MLMLFCWLAWVFAGWSPPIRLLRRYVCCEHVLCGKEATATAAALRQRCSFAFSWAMDVRRRLRPLDSRLKHTQHCAVLEFMPSSWLVCVGLKIRIFRLMPEAERLPAPRLSSVVRVPGV